MFSWVSGPLKGTPLWAALEHPAPFQYTSFLVASFAFSLVHDLG